MDSIVVRSESGRVIFTLVAPDPTKRPGQLDAFLERNGGQGVQHLAFLVEDIVPAVREFGAKGPSSCPPRSRYYDMLTERIPDLQEGIAS